MEAMIAGVGMSLFGYNRKNYMFDKELLQEREYTGQNMRIKQFALYREDIRDMMELTCAKMDNYLIINTIQMTFIVRLFCEGQPDTETPWPIYLHWLWASSNVGALLYMVLSIWLSMHASIAAHAFGVRLLTQFVRLPVASKEQLDEASYTGQQYEGAGAHEMLRIPLLGQQWRRLNAAMADETTSDSAEASSAPPVQATPAPTPSRLNRRGTFGGAGSSESEAGADAVAEQVAPAGQPQPEAEAIAAPTAMLEHVRLYREIQGNWQAYDAYSRVCMAMGTNQLLMALGYFIVGMLIAENHAPWPAGLVFLMFVVCAWLLARLDLYIHKRTLRMAGVLLITGPTLTIISVTINMTQMPRSVKIFGDVLVPIIFLVNGAWIYFIIKLAEAERVGQVALPSKWRSVLYLDVFGTLHPDPPAAQPPQGEAQEMRRQRSSSTLATAHLRESLGALCRKLRLDLSQELARWESDGVAAKLENQASTFEIIARIRARFDNVAGNLAQMDEGESGELSPTEATQDVWLKVDFNTSDRTMDLFYKCDTGDVAWVRPSEPTAHILDLEGLEGRLETFSDKVRAFAQFEPQNESHGQAASSSAAATAASSEPQRMITASEADNRGRAADTNNPAQELRYGGREGVQLRSNPGLRETHFAHSSAVGPTFHPERRGGDAVSVSSRPPGHMPWRTFLQGSIVLLCVWACGFVWSVIAVWGKVDIPLEPLKPEFLLTAAVPLGTRTRSTLGRFRFEDPEVIFSGPWPHSFFSPKSLACDPSLGSRLLVSETYAAHTVSITDALDVASPNVEPAIAECLAQAPEFQAGGLRSVTVKCGRQASDAEEAKSDCVALLLAMDGRSALQCNLNADAKGSDLVLHGGYVDALAADSESNAVWALRGKTIVELTPRSGAAHEFVPRRELVRNVAANVTQLHVLNSDVILGLDSHGQLHAWSTTGKPSLHWRFPKGKRWMGMCASAGMIYAIGSAKADDTLAVWRFRLPAELT